MKDLPPEEHRRFFRGYFSFLLSYSPMKPNHCFFAMGHRPWRSHKSWDRGSRIIPNPAHSGLQAEMPFLRKWNAAKLLGQSGPMKNHVLIEDSHYPLSFLSQVRYASISGLSGSTESTYSTRPSSRSRYRASVSCSPCRARWEATPNFRQ